MENHLPWWCKRCNRGKYRSSYLSPPPIFGHSRASNALYTDSLSENLQEEVFEWQGPTPNYALAASHEIQTVSQLEVLGENTIARQNAASAVPQPIQIIQKKRYKQTEELKLTQRLNDLRSKHGFPHPADSRIVLFNKINCRRQRNSHIRRIRWLPRFSIHLTRCFLK
jgi:hypothetical protein